MTKDIQQNLKITIEKALNKIQGKREKEICRYLPGPRGGYIHHFTFKKMKEKEPAKCISLLEEFILHPHQPFELAPTPRAPRGLNRANNQIKLPNEMINRIIQIARENGDDSLLAKILAARPLNQVKRELIRAVRDNIADQELWEAYKEAVQAQ
ncbi:MAG: hypothetical protein R3E91_04140 [Chlamydiales bacterium]